MGSLDEILIRSYIQVNSSRVTSTEDITCDPSHRMPFLEFVHQEAPELTEARALRRLSYLRKAKRLPRFARAERSPK